MAVLYEVKPTKTFMGRLEHDADLLEEITKFCVENNIRSGRVEALGALKNARLGFYNQSTFEYEYHEFNEPLEITNLIGNISVKDGAPMVHAHVTLSDDEGKAFGGHLSPGTTIFACEIIIQVFDGPEFTRGFDQQTRLPLWEME